MSFFSGLWRNSYVLSRFRNHARNLFQQEPNLVFVLYPLEEDAIFKQIWIHQTTNLSKRKQEVRIVTSMCRRQLLQSAAPNAMLNIILIKRHQSQYCFVTRSSKLAFCHTIAVMSRGYYLASTASHRTVAIKVVFILMNMFLITFHKQNIYTTMHHTFLCYNLSSYFTHYLIVAKLTNTSFLTPCHAIASQFAKKN